VDVDVDVDVAVDAVYPPQEFIQCRLRVPVSSRGRRRICCDCWLGARAALARMRDVRSGDAGCPRLASHSRKSVSPVGADAWLRPSKKRQQVRAIEVFRLQGNST